MSNYCLEMNNISKRFLSLQALDNACFQLKKGEVRALLGINGAGKSTLIKILSGVYQKDGGEILINGKLADINQPQDALSHGISTVYQDPQMIESFTGYENIYLGHENSSKGMLSRMSRKDMLKEAKALLKKYPLDIDLEKPVYLLSMIEREIIAVLKALSKNCDILILDEPTSILTEKEKHILFDVIKVLKSNGVSIIYITHHLDEIKQICDGFTVFRNGKSVGSKLMTDDAVTSGDIAELMLGKKLESLYPPKTVSNVPTTCFEVNDLKLEHKFHNISFEARKGEIFGIFGLVGSGIDEISKIIFGAMKSDAGEVFLNGKSIDLSTPKKVIDAGVFLVPGDRKGEGQVGELSIAKNITLAKMQRVVNKFFLVKKSKENSMAEEMVKQLSIATTGIQKNVMDLSGGNQQKVVISKGIFTQAQVYIFTEPTVGVDVGAKFAIYEMMRNLSKEAAVIIISSDPEEVLGNADKIMVIHKGVCNLEKNAGDTTLNEMLVCATTSQQDSVR